MSIDNKKKFDAHTDSEKYIDAHCHLPYSDETLEEKKEIIKKVWKDLNIEKSIVISDSLQTSTIGNNDECLKLFEKEENVKICLGVNLETDLSHLEDLISENRNRVAGIKLFPGHEDYHIDNPKVKDIIKICLKNNLPLLIHTGWENVDHCSEIMIEDIAKEFRELTIVLCHCFYPNIKECFDTFEKYKNIKFDLSSVADKKTDIDKFAEPISIFAQKNYKRILFGTDFQCCDIYLHKQLVEALKISNFKKHFIRYKNALKLYFK